MQVKYTHIGDQREKKKRKGGKNRGVCVLLCEQKVLTIFKL